MEEGGEKEREGEKRGKKRGGDGKGERRRRATYTHGQEVLLGQRHLDPGNSCIHWPVLGAGDTLGTLAAV